MRAELGDAVAAFRRDSRAKEMLVSRSLFGRNGRMVSVYPRHNEHSGAVPEAGVPRWGL